MADNSTIGQDTGALPITPELIPLPIWFTMSHVDRHVIICLVKLHQLIRSYPLDFHDLDDLPWHFLDRQCRDLVVTLSRHQAEAIRLVQQQLHNSNTTNPDPGLFTHLVGLLECQIQQGAFEMQRAHLLGVKALLEKWGRVSPLNIVETDTYIVMCVDIFRCTTASSNCMSSETCDQHAEYFDMIPNFSTLSVLGSLSPIPTQLIIAVVLINMSRSRNLQENIRERFKDTRASALDLIHSFSPQAWVELIVRHLQQNHEEMHISQQIDWNSGWLALGQFFLSATTLYFFLVQDDTGDIMANDVAMPQLRTKAYNSLVETIMHLFKRRQTDFNSSRIHKFIAWPMVVAGVEAVVKHRDYIQVSRISTWLRLLTSELGTLTMRQAAKFLERLSSVYQRRGPDYQYKGGTDWDDMFGKGSMFLY